ncbi:CTP pyrophosphohydrolase [Corynebacterium kalinowskii]|uniref:8-oxo-dGTP diphosphatase n=1 Tax=Corynebacterium kalinowskii TaxID=2675216 RepID=A0A6B8VFE2_9CORY|nr:(deoxy)nucleoside triphosphate pyrophosphohydrolase [Corynebacterium kalinowskii]QGU01749.1 CTP pyrophosphohydrolase [Corynebacterium kalinowskii]
MKKRIEVTGAVIVRDGKVLCARRGEGKSLAGYWEFPGGKIEPGETPEESLARELKEELLCDAEVGSHITTTEHEYDFAIIVLSTYYCTLVKGEPVLTEHAEIRWLTGTEMLELEWAPADVPAVELIAKEY